MHHSQRIRLFLGVLFWLLGSCGALGASWPRTWPLLKSLPLSANIAFFVAEGLLVSTVCSFLKTHFSYFLEFCTTLSEYGFFWWVFVCSWALCGSWGPTWAQLEPNLGPTWPNLAQLGPNLAPTWPNLAPTWSKLVRSLSRLHS